MRETTLSTVPSEDLISPEFMAFSRRVVARDGVLDVYLHRGAGPVAVSGGQYGAQTIQSQAMADDLVVFLQSSLGTLDRQLGLDIQFVTQPEQADVRFYLDSNIDLGDGSLILGIALSNERPDGGFWEVMLNAPQFVGQPEYFRYAALHELGHTMGLEHPFDASDQDVYLSSNPYRSAYPDESLMAYRNPRSGGWPTSYTASDLAALASIWGPPVPGPSSRLIGTPEADRLTGGPGDEQLRGLAGADHLRGGRGSNWYSSPTDSAEDWLLITRDGSLSLKSSRRSVDVITELGSEDHVAILGARTSQLHVSRVSIKSPAYGQLDGLGVFAFGRLEALYTGGEFNRLQFSQLTIGLPTDTLA